MRTPSPTLLLGLALALLLLAGCQAGDASPVPDSGPAATAATEEATEARQRDLGLEN